jgi:hypothetical protein
MPGQTREEGIRLGTHLLGFLKKTAGDFADGAREMAGEIRSTAADVAKEFRSTAKDVRKHVETEVLPQAGRFAETVAAHGDLTIRRVGAELRETLRDEGPLAKEKQHEFELSNMAVNQKVHLHAPTRSFLLSAAAVLQSFDATGEEIKGIALFPREKNLAVLKDEYVSHRLFIGAEGLMCRVYAQNEAALRDPEKPRYTFKEQRPATADDLFQLQLTSRDVLATLETFKSSERFKAFTAKR